MLAAAAVCPHPPLIVPELAGAAAPELDELRSACHAAITGLLAADPDLLVVVGGADTTSRYDGGAAGTLRPWGADVTVGHGDPVLPLSLTIGRWLLEDHDVAAFQAVAFDAAPGDCLALGADLVRDGRVALLVMADGSARLTEKAPGHHDPAAQPYNEVIARAIADADVSALAHLDPAKADRLWVAGRAALQVLAGAAGPGDVKGQLLADLAPYGVGYFVGLWR
ncbi:class III extradiol dioxygenase subunit B-like domain-containing protein [Nonomuraea cavernae]|uniref:Extradiol ring-cleavage dioxygenase class III enzyme subunit B domain-containing protein n=1 Tax=Nonomuraea cavernae TaxID=2045107 RepID=A0A917YW57_9ACTN|nr:class III extradiol dioxygenase subunit B-like domain-containing protein [Nonomuraea cavernae]MCA2185315.1 class III extradiol dioxygenase subunit B-like domain-containing protein [Nonomuraea cavernae]GGO66086.1 hypothetical protein GCM10012289_19260 [Nonomuraea cavernae]